MDFPARFPNAALTEVRAVAQKRSVPQPAPPGCGISTSSTPNAFGVFSPEGVSPQDFLEGEIQAAADHSEIIPGPIDHAKTQVVSPTEVPREPNFETSAKLTEEFRFGAEMFGLSVDSEGVRRPLRVKFIPFAAAENRAKTGPCIRR